METKENLKERLKHQVMERMDISRTMEDEEILELVQKTLEEDSHRMPMSISMRQNLIREIFHSLRRLDILQELIAVSYTHLTSAFATFPVSRRYSASLFP